MTSRRTQLLDFFAMAATPAAQQQQHQWQPNFPHSTPHTGMINKLLVGDAVKSQCTRRVYVHICRSTLYKHRLRAQCTCTVYKHSVRAQCRSTVYKHSVRAQCRSTV